jgi:hypothetical protein
MSPKYEPLIKKHIYYIDIYFRAVLEWLKVGNGALKKIHEVEMLMKWRGFRKKQEKE